MCRRNSCRIAGSTGHGKRQSRRLRRAGRRISEYTGQDLGHGYACPCHRDVNKVLLNVKSLQLERVRQPNVPGHVHEGDSATRCMHQCSSHDTGGHEVADLGTHVHDAAHPQPSTGERKHVEHPKQLLHRFELSAGPYCFHLRIMWLDNIIWGRHYGASKSVALAILHRPSSHSLQEDTVSGCLHCARFPCEVHQRNGGVAVPRLQQCLVTFGWV
mmetsp:Transcript_85397/g.274850  ORF Transcript_85397/g.274850 Transcript_85397/m.274850 type:complete len:215 (+) Transcript_85397:292-936(+)